MRYLFAFLLLAHGLIHLMGFAKAFKYAEISQLTQPISRGAGALWLLAALLFILTAGLLLVQKDYWWMAAIPALLLSQGLIFSSWHDARFGSIANGIILVVTIIGYATAGFYAKFEREVSQGLKWTASLPESMLTEADLQDLPGPVRQYLRYTGAVGKPKVYNFKVLFEGQIRKNEQSAWMPFVSEQYNFMDASTRLFFLKATMKHLPVAGFHRFVNGEAMMDIRLFSLIKVQYQSGKEMGIAETVTFFNDMCCMAPATLIDKRIQWLEVVENKVKASFTNKGITISAWLYFNEEGALVNFVSGDRYAVSDNNQMQQLPWSTPLKDYMDLNGHKLPGYAETVYTYPEGDFCYGTFRLTGLEYNCKDFIRPQ